MLVKSNSRLGVKTADVWVICLPLSLDLIVDLHMLSKSYIKGPKNPTEVHSHEQQVGKSCLSYSQAPSDSDRQLRIITRRVHQISELETSHVLALEENIVECQRRQL